MTGDRSGERLRAVTLSVLMVFSVFAGTLAFAGPSVAAGNTAGSVGITVDSAGNTATVTVDDPDLNTDPGSAQSHVINVQSSSERFEGSATAGSDAPDGGSHEFAVAGTSAVADRTGDGVITAADFTLDGAADESITGVTVKNGQYYVTVSDAGAPDDGAAETVTYTQQVTAATGTDTTDGTTQTVTTGSPLGDMNGDGTIDTDDVRISGASDETVTSVSPNPDGTADITIADSGATSDGSESDGGGQEILAYVPSETATLVETGPDTGTFTGSVALVETDGNGAVLVGNGDAVEAVYWEGGSTRKTASGTYTTADTGAPAISSVILAESSGDIVVQFDSNETLGDGTSAVTATVTGPGGKTYTYDRAAFTESGSGPYTYSAAGPASYDDGDGTYTLSVDDAVDPAGNNGGNDGEGSELGTTYDYSAGGGGDTTPPAISGFSASNPTGQTVKVQFGSDEQLSTIQVDITGQETATLSASDFTESSQDGGYFYTATYSAGSDGDYTATLVDASDDAGNNGAGGESGSVTIGGGEEGGPGLPPAPHVSFGTSELSTGGYTSLFVVLNADGEVASVDDLELRFYNTTESTSTPIVTKTDLNTIKGFEMLTVPKSELGASQFSGKIELVDTASSTVLDSASTTVHVYDGVSTDVSATTLDESADSGIDISYDLGNIAPEDAEIVVDTTTLNSGFTTTTKSVGQSSGTVTIDLQASAVNRDFSARAFVRDTSRSRQVQSSMSRTCIGTTSSPCPQVQSTSVTYANGTTVTGVGVSTEFNWYRNGLDFHLHPTGQPETKELTGVSGLDRNTEINVTLTLDGFDPTFVMGTANAEQWDYEALGNGVYEATITLQPAEVYWNDKVENPDPNEWPLKNASANVHYDAIVDMSVISIQNNFADKVQGGMVVSDAQAFGPPRYTAPSGGNSGKLKITVAAPHYETDGSTLNSGFYTAVVPSGITSEWGVDASQLTATFGSQSLASKIDTLESGAIKVATDIHYSSGTVTVSGDASKPVAKTGSDKTADEDTAVSFDATGSTDEGSITGYAWDFDGDGTTDATGATPSHTFADPGTYDVTLTVTDNDGKTATNTVTVTVADVTAPAAAAGADTTVDEDTAVSFDATGSSDNGRIATYAWDFDGDGSVESTSKRPSHTFADPGTYDVTLSVTDTGGNTATDTRTVTVADVTGPAAAAGSDRTVTADESVDFDATASADNGQIGSYEWDFDGDGTTDATGATPSHTFSSTGSYDVTLTVTDGGGNTATDTVTVTVERDADSGSSTNDGSSSGSGEAADGAGSSVTTTRTGDAVTVEVTGGSDDETVRIDTGGGPEAADSDVRVDGLSVDTTAEEFTLTVSGHDAAPDAVPEPTQTEVGAATAGYLRIDHSMPDEAISRVGIDFSVGWKRLAGGTTASEVVLYRYHDGQWQALSTTFVGYTAEGARFEADSPGLSVFAVGTKRAPSLTVSPTPPATGAIVGEPVAVSTRVTNDGTASGMRTLSLRVDGSVRATETVTVAPGENVTVELTTRFDAAGTYDLRVDGVDAGTVSVSAEPTAVATATDAPTAAPTATPTTTPAPTATATATPASGPEPVSTGGTPAETDSAGGPGFGAGLALVALAALAVALAWRHR